MKVTIELKRSDLDLMPEFFHVRFLVPAFAQLDKEPPLTPGAPILITIDTKPEASAA